MQSNEEFWKDIPGWEGKYLASNKGRIKSLPKTVTLYHGGTYTTPERILSSRVSGDGYSLSALFDGKNRLDIQTHILIAKTFLINPYNKKEVNHIDGIKTNNNILNLEWVTKSENTIHAYKNGLMRPQQLGKKGLKSVNYVKVQCTATGRVMTIKDAAEYMNVSSTGMFDMLNGRYNNWTTIIKL